MAIRIDDNLLAAAISYVRSLTQRRTFFMKMGRLPRFALNFAIEGEADIANSGRNVRYWHLADIEELPANVCSWGQSGRALAVVSSKSAVC